MRVTDLTRAMLVDAREDAVVDSSGNVFADLNLPYSQEDMLKVEISRAIAATIRRRRLTQAEAAKIVHADQAKISALLRGRLKDFAVERLIRYLVLLGRDIDIRISARSGDKPGRVKVVEARLLTPSERRSMERVTREIHAEMAKLLKDYQPLWMWESPHCDSAGNVAPWNPLP